MFQDAILENYWLHSERSAANWSMFNQFKHYNAWFKHYAMLKSELKHVAFLLIENNGKASLCGCPDSSHVKVAFFRRRVWWHPALNSRGLDQFLQTLPFHIQKVTVTVN